MVVAAELREGMVIRFSDVAEARVVETAPPAHSQQGSAWKEVTLEIGLSIRVPLFITPGEVVQVDLKTVVTSNERGPNGSETRQELSFPVRVEGSPMLELKAVRMDFPADANIIVGQSHFIKTVEDLYEAIVSTVPQAKFGVAFNESSGACLTRSEGNEQALRDAAIRNAQALGSGHTFVLIIQNAYPINVLGAVRNVPEVCSIFCATANSVEIIVAQSEQGRGVLGVIDGSSPKGVEGDTDIVWRHDLLRKIGYKR